MPSITAPPSSTLERKALAAPSKAAPRRTVKTNPEGIVRAIVAVTGVVDAVDDLIVPGAFTASLAIRNPKVVDDHEWGRKAGRVLHIEEWLPGDKRLPKRTKEGRPWPAEAGALVATMQYNLRSEAGRESFEWVRFYAESNEAEFSIGYKVPEGKARKRGDGVRVILMVNLFELSHVLFGAAPLSMALEVKGLHGETAGATSRPALPKAARVADEDDDAYEDVSTDETKPWDEDEDRAGMESKTAAAVLLEAKALAGDGNQGNAESLRKWFVAGADGAIAWGSPGDFDACVAIASKHMSPEHAKGYCNLRHHDAMGVYPATHAAMEGKSAYDALLQAKSLLADAETKSASLMKGSYEERRELIRAAAQDLLNATGECEFPWVSLTATYDEEVVVSASGHDDVTRSFFIGYTYDEAAGTVDLGEPEEVEISLVAEPKHPFMAAEEPDVEEVAVVKPMLDELDRLWGAAQVETKHGERVRARFAEFAATLQGKSADADPTSDASDGSTITADTLPGGDWQVYRKIEPIEALRMDGPFTVETRDGVVTSEDGWLALDSDGYPYPIAADEFDNVYEPESVEPAAEVEAEVEAPAVDADVETKAPDEEPAEDDDEMVTINADDHFDAMAALEMDDETDDE